MKNQKNYYTQSDMNNMMIRLHVRHNRRDQTRELFFKMQKWRYAYSLFVLIFLNIENLPTSIFVFCKI